MNKTLKSVICICLCAVLMFGVFTAPIVQPKADAFAITATAGMIAIGVTLLTMLGITFASVGAAEQASKSLLEGSQDIFDWVNDLSLQGGSGGEPGDGKWFKLGATTMAGLATFVNKARELFGNGANSGSVPVPDETMGVICNVPFTYKTSFISDEEAYKCATYNYKNIVSPNAVNISINGVLYSFYVINGVYSDGYSYSRVLVNGNTLLGGSSEYGKYSNSAYKNIIDCRLGFRLVSVNDVQYLYPFTACRYVDADGYECYDADYPVAVWENRGRVPFNVDSVSSFYNNVPYQNVSPYELNILYNALAEKLQTQEITFDYTDTLDQIENHSEEQLQVSQDQLLEQAQIRDLLEQIKAGQGGTTKTELQESDLNVPETHNLTWKFPFCVPFDLIALVGALNATPQDPKWQIPFHIESLSIDESIELDLTKFEPVTNVLRVVTTIAFLLGLIMVTRKMIKG